MALQNRNSVLAVVPETTEGTPVAPTGATQYTALQEDFSIDPSFDELENEELRASIGAAESILGIENPTLQFSHYMRASGTEGSAPDYNDLLKALFGAEVVAGTQYDTVAGSTAAIVNVDTGEGVNFQRGQALLVKDATNGYSIRPVLSVSSDALTLGFNLANAPAAVTNLGKAILYKPASTGHQTLSLWCYRANGGGIEMVSGARVTEMNLEFNAGDLINAQYNLAGVQYYFNPIEITSADRYLDFLDNATTRVATVTAKIYKDPHELADAIASSMNSLGSANTFTCTYSDTTGKFTLTSTHATFTLKWATGANTSNTIGDKIGFVVSGDDSGAQTYTSDNAMTLTSPYTPTYDSAGPLAAKDNELLIGSATDTTSVAAQRVSVSFIDERQPLRDISVVSGVSGSLINKREVVVNVVAYLSQYDVSKFKKFRAGTSTGLLYNFGTKVGGNWVAGKCGCFYIPTGRLSKFKIGNDNGIITLEMEMRAFVDSSGNGEVYLNFV